MPSLATRIAYDRMTLKTAQADLAQAAQTVSAATDQLEALQSGDLELTAIKVGGQKFINNGGNLEPDL